MIHSKFYSSLVLLIVLNAVIKPLWIFGIDRQVQNIAGITEYGAYFSLLNLSIVFGFLLDWGLNNFVNRELAARRLKLQEQLGTFLFLRLLFFLVYSVTVVAVAKLSGVTRWDILPGVVLIQFLTFSLLFLRNVVTANQWFKTDAWLSVLDKTLMIIGCGALILLPAVFGQMNIHRFITAQVACTTIAIGIVVTILLLRGIRFRKPNLRFIDRRVVYSALPFALTLFLMSVHIRLDGFLLERLRPDGTHEAGVYAAAYRLLDASNMVGYLIASFFLPFIARLWSDGKLMHESILQTRHVQLMFAIGVATIAITMAPWLASVLYHRQDPYTATILRWCLPALIGYALTQVYGTVMTATGSIVMFSIFNLGAVMINVILNLFLIPRYGAFGCCIAALCSQLLLGISTMIFVHRKFEMTMDFKSLAFYLLTGVINGVIVLQLMKTQVNAILLITLAALITLGMMWLGKMLTVTAWLSFLKKQ